MYCLKGLCQVILESWLIFAAVSRIIHNDWNCERNCVTEDGSQRQPGSASSVWVSSVQGTQRIVFNTPRWSIHCSRSLKGHSQTSATMNPWHLLPTVMETLVQWYRSVRVSISSFVEIHPLMIRGTSSDQCRGLSGYHSYFSKACTKLSGC